MLVKILHRELNIVISGPSFLQHHFWNTWHYALSKHGQVDSRPKCMTWGDSTNRAFYENSLPTVIWPLRKTLKEDGASATSVSTPLTYYIARRETENNGSKLVNCQHGVALMGWWSAHCNALEDGSTWTDSWYLRGMDIQSELEIS